MADVHDKAARRRNMAAVKAKHTKPELMVRHGLFRRGFRYRLHYSALPGTPDLVLPKYRAAIQVQGCFWHGHDCDLFQWPATRKHFWKRKIQENQLRDQRASEGVIASGWRLLTIWECALRGASAMPVEQVIDKAVVWLRGSRRFGEIRARRRISGSY